MRLVRNTSKAGLSGRNGTGWEWISIQHFFHTPKLRMVLRWRTRTGAFDNSGSNTASRAVTSVLQLAKRWERLVSRTFGFLMATRIRLPIVVVRGNV